MYAIIAWNLTFLCFLSKSMCILDFGLSWSFSDAFPCCLSVRIFAYVILVVIYYNKSVLVPLSQVVMSLCHLPLLVIRISFYCFGMSFFVRIVLPCLVIFSIILISPVLFSLFPRLVFTFFFSYLFFLFVPAYSSVFSLFYRFSLS